MAFQIKDFSSIAASLLNVLRSITTKVTDFNRGSVVRSMLEATAAELEELYLQIYTGLKEAIPVSVFRTFGFESLPAQSASGVLRFRTPGSALATVAVAIPASTQVRVPGTGLTYETQEAGVIAIGNSYVDILAVATAAGIGNNTGADTITELVAAVFGVGSVTNPAPLINGRDAEGDDARRIRFQAYIASLARGTGAAVEYGVKQASLTNELGVITEYVAQALVVEPYNTDTGAPIGLVYIYVHNGASATSVDLVARAQQVVDGYYDGSVAVPGWRAAGVQAIVQAASDQPVNVTGTVVVDGGYDAATVLAECQSAIKAHLQGLSVGEDVRVSELVAIIRRDVSGAFNVSLSAPTVDVTVAATAKAIPGTITLTEA